MPDNNLIIFDILIYNQLHFDNLMIYMIYLFVFHSIKRNLICKEADKANSASMRMPDQPD